MARSAARGGRERVRLGTTGAALPAATALTLAHRLPILAGRESVRLGTTGAALPAATALMLAHRLPILAGLSSGGGAAAGRVSRMTREEPAAFWAGLARGRPVALAPVAHLGSRGAPGKQSPAPRNSPVRRVFTKRDSPCGKEPP